MKTHWKKLRNKTYLGSYDLQDKNGNNTEVTATIQKVVQETTKNRNGDDQESIILYAEGLLKPMFLNDINANTLSSLYNTNFIEEWKGKKFVLFIKKEWHFGAHVDVLRIKKYVEKVKPELKADTKEFTQCVNALKDKYTIEQISKKYTLSEDIKTKLLSESKKNKEVKNG